MSSSTDIPSPGEWTSVQSRKFDAAATAAFSTKRTPRTQKPDAGRAEFTGLAATAFSSKRKGEKSEPTATPSAPTDAKEPVVTQSRFASALAAMPTVPSVPSAPAGAMPIGQVFGKKQRSADSSRFDDAAASAFGKKTVEAKEPSLFDDVAASAFGKKRHDGGDNLFDDQAASVFGKKRHDRRQREDDQARPTIVLEKPNTLWASISGLIPDAAKEPERQWSGSAIRQQKKKAEAEAAAAIATKKQMNAIEVTDSDFPTLGMSPKPTSKPVSKSSSGNSFSALADDFPTLGSKPVSKSNSSTSFAEIMRKRIEQEEAEARAEAERKAKEQHRRERELMERLNNPLIRIRHAPSNTNNYYDEDDYNPDYNEENDLDYVHPSEMARRGNNYYAQDDDDDYAPEDDEEEQQETAW
jgi:hypothetical protein